MPIEARPAPLHPHHQDPGSFRDPDSQVFVAPDGVYRALSAAALADYEALAATRLFAQATRDGRLVDTRAVDPATLDGAGERYAGVLRHERIPLVSYPYEWSFSMLRDAAVLTLELVADALDEGLILKDGTPYNVQFRGARPTFIDIGSFERLRQGEPWYGYRQFCQQMLYPLLLQAYRGIDFHPLLRGRLEGITPDQCRRMLSLRDWRRRGVLTHVVLHARLERAYGDTRASSDVRDAVRKAGFQTDLLKSNVSSLLRLVRSLHWDPGSSEWSGYRSDNSYTDADVRAKVQFVAQITGARRRRMVWDLGANDGRFSLLAADSADVVVALDSDHLTVDRLYRDLRRRNETRVLPLLMDLADPSPGLGWDNVERPPLTRRGRPELLLALALLHHLALGRNVPLETLSRWLAGLGDEAVVEFATREDPQVQRLLRGKREGVHDDYTLENFEAALTRHADIRARTPLPSGTRILYHTVPRT